MKYETVPGVTLPKIGFGAWSIGGDSHPDSSRDAASRNALRSALEIGYTHFDTAEAYAAGHSETPIITNQIPYRIPDRTYVQNGVIEYCQQNDILITVYSPVKFRMIKLSKTINAMANAHSATPFQIALAWLVMQPRVITISMSFKPDHIRENFEASDIELTQEEFQALNVVV